MRRLVALLGAQLLSAVANAETNQAWVPASATGDRDIGAWRIPADASLVVSGSDWASAAIVPFGGLAATAPVWTCTGEVAVGADTGCPAQGFGPKSQVRQNAPAPPPPPVVVGDATLTWEAPTTRVDGSPLTNLAGFRVYYGTNSGNLSNQLQIANSGARSQVLSGLTAGLWYFAISAYDAAGLESARSNQVSKDIAGTAPPPPPPPPPPPAVVVVENRPGVPFAVVFGITATGARSSTVLGFAPVGAATVGPVVFRYRGQDYCRLAIGVVLWWPTTTTPTANAAAACR